MANLKSGGSSQELLQYISDNVQRADIAIVLDSWQKTSGLKLAHEETADIVLGYLGAEYDTLKWKYPIDDVKKAGIGVLSNHLDEIANNDRLSTIGVEMGRALGTPFLALASRNRYGRLAVKVVPAQSEIYIDGRFLDYSDNEFVLVVGAHQVSIKNEPVYKSFSKDITIESAKKTAITCELQKQ
jgi:hypothetical protein